MNLADEEIAIATSNLCVGNVDHVLLNKANAEVVCKPLPPKKKHTPV